MNVALFFITHEGIASELLNIATAILKQESTNTDFIEVPMDSQIEKNLDDGIKKIDALDIDKGLIILTDLYGSTPSNIAHSLASKYNANLISGINLPMLIRLLNYPNDNLDVLTKKAIEGGKSGIIDHQDQQQITIA